jgi:hypothetical protein
MSGPRQVPDEWPVDREVEYLESKLGPFDSHGDWQQKRGEEREGRLGEDGHRLASSLGSIETFLQDYDMTPEEAIDCLLYEIQQYRGESENDDEWPYCPNCGAKLEDPAGPFHEVTDCPNCGQVDIDFYQS